MEIKNKANILFIYKDFSTFVRSDYENLSQFYSVKLFKSNLGKSFFQFIIPLIHQFFFLLFHIHKFDVVFCWFADYHSFLPLFFVKLFGKKSYLVLGGYDVQYIPELKYGSFSNPLRSFCSRYSIENCTYNLAVSDNLINDAKKRTKKGKFILLPTGYNPDSFVFGHEKENIVLTVSITSTYQRYMVKGLDRFVELARICPDFQFIIIGIEPKTKTFFEPVPTNLKLIGSVKPDELKLWYKKSAFYAQFSRSEGLPNSICEAMLSGCIPIGVNSGGISYAMGEQGILIDEWDKHIMKNLLMQTKWNQSKGFAARESIINRFHIDLRKDFLSNLINPLK